jgi:hypothetical protein
VPDSWRVPYLVNVILVLRADGQVVPREALYLSIVRRRLEMGPLALAEAIIRASGEDRPRANGSVISDECNLRSMLTAALIDGSVSPDEDAVIRLFVDQAQISALRVAAIAREAVDGVTSTQRAIDAQCGNAP